MPSLLLGLAGHRCCYLLDFLEGQLLFAGRLGQERGAGVVGGVTVQEAVVARTLGALHLHQLATLTPLHAAAELEMRRVAALHSPDKKIDYISDIIG